MSLGIIFDNPMRQQRKVYWIDVNLSVLEIINIANFWSIRSNQVWEDVDEGIKKLNSEFRRVDLDCDIEANNTPDTIIVIIVSN